MARHQGRVVFVRHALPGEAVLARLTEAGRRDRFWRADAVEVLRAAPGRVRPVCPLSGPGGCGGCDWQHAAVPEQRRLKAAVITEQLVRLGRLDPQAPPLAGLQVRPVPGDDGGLGWRTRVRFTVDDDGRPGLRRHRSHQVVGVPHCPIAHPAVNEVQAGQRRWPGTGTVEVIAGGAGLQRLVIVEPRPQPPGDVRPDGARPEGVRRPQEARRSLAVRGRAEVPPLAVEASLARRGEQGLHRLRGRTWVAESVTVDGVRRDFRVTGGGFWQVHPGAAQTLLDAVLDLADPRPGESAVDLYCGVGLFTAGLALRVGERGRVLGVEGDPRAAADARRSLHDLPVVRLDSGGVEPVLRALAGTGELSGADVVVLDPPRSGAGRRVIEAVTALRPRVIVYVACDPAALARDVAVAGELGYRTDALAAFDTFPMTHHVECVARLTPTSS